MINANTERMMRMMIEQFSLDILLLWQFTMILKK